MDFNGYYRTRSSKVLFKSEFFSYQNGKQWKVSPINSDKGPAIVTSEQLTSWLRQGLVTKVKKEDILKPNKISFKHKVLGLSDDLIKQLDIL